MSIFVIGINHKTASIALREKIYFSADKLSLYLQDILNLSIAREVVLLSTCNRSELYCEADDIHAASAWFYSQSSLPESELDSSIYIYQEEQAVAHMMQVACGLDSMILGEPQILGQMKEAFSESCSAGAVGPVLQRLFQQVFMVAKEIRTTTSIGACPVSVASAAVHFAKQQLAGIDKAKVVLIGASETTELLMRYLTTWQPIEMTLVNRTLDNAKPFIEKFGGSYAALNELVSVLANADIVFSATSSIVPIVTQKIVSAANAMRHNKPLIMIDIAVPRDIEPSVAELANVKLYCVDDLKNIIEQNRQGREHGAEKAREMIREKSAEFIAELKAIDKVTNTIRAYRGQIEEICRAELLKAKQQLQQGIAPAKVLEAFAHAYTNKLLHAPSVQLRQAGVEGRFEFLSFATQLFSLPDAETTLL